MKVTCDRSVLLAGVQTVARAVSSKTTLPVLANMLLDATGDRLRLMATDLEIGMTAFVAASIEDAGAITLPARILSEVVNNLPEAAVTLETDDSRAAKIVCERAEYAIRGLDADEFPTAPEIDDSATFTIEQRVLKRVIEQTCFAASTDETRPILTGALFVLKPSGLDVVATDTHRLALAKVEASIEAALERSVIVPARALREVERVLDEHSEEPVVASLGPNHVKFTLPRVTLWSRLIEGQFPNYEKVIPTSSDKRLIIHRETLTDALRRALVVAREDANRVILQTEGETLTLSADSQDVGTAHEEIPVELEGDPIEIAFNGRYLMQVLEILESQQVSVELVGALNPGVIRPIDESGYVYVLMPMQIM
jgi:DNA polymerase-3 subunit beta